MENFEKKKIEFSQINGGLKFKNGDAVSAEAINAPIEASAYAQEVAEEAKRIAEESGGGGTVDLSNYVQKTDYAGNGEGQAGIVRGFAGQYGLGQNETAKSAYIIRASDQEILAKKNPSQLDALLKIRALLQSIEPRYHSPKPSSDQ